MSGALRNVDLVIPGSTWDQNCDDVLTYHVNAAYMSDEWQGNERFECLSNVCTVQYFERTSRISSADVKQQRRF